MTNLEARTINMMSAYCYKCTMCGPLWFDALPDEDELIEMELKWAEHIQSHMEHPHQTSQETS